MKIRALHFVLSLLLVVLCFGVAQAHEFILKPVSTAVAPGQNTAFSAVSAHVFMVSEEVEPLEYVKVSLVSGDETTPLTVAVNEPALTLDGAFTAKAEGTAILAGHREGVIWTNTTQGWVMGSKKGLDGVISSGLYEKFCKTLITVGKADDGWSKVLGQTLEIVPLTDPTQAKAGDDVEFKILFDGQPFAPDMVLATYDGFVDYPNTYAYYTEPDEQGLAKVKITTPGLWMVRVQKVMEEGTEDYDKHVMRAVLIFEVN